jgi:Cu(I)-responsive transcriptional regulator
MRIGKVATEAGVSVQAIRFYERHGLLSEPERLASGYRAYSADTVRIVRFIKQSQELGYTLNEVKQLLQLRERRSGNAAQVRALAEAKIRSIDERIRCLRRMRDELSSLLDACACGDAQPMCPALEALDQSATGL